MSSEIEKLNRDYFALAVFRSNLSKILKVYKFFLPKHGTTITEKQIKRKFKPVEYRVYTKRNPDKFGELIILPLIWVRKDVCKTYHKCFRYFLTIEFRDIMNPFCLIDSNEFPFYLLRKYGNRKNGVEREIFSVAKIIRKKEKALFKQICELELKRKRKELK